MTTKTDTTDYQDEWRDEMLQALLQLIGWYKLGLPTRENFNICLNNYKARIGND